MAPHTHDRTGRTIAERLDEWHDRTAPARAIDDTRPPFPEDAPPWRPYWSERPGWQPIAGDALAWKHADGAELYADTDPRTSANRWTLRLPDGTTSEHPLMTEAIDAAVSARFARRTP